MENPASCSPTAQQEKQKHRREVQRAYYWKNRDKLLAQQRVYYQNRDKAAHAARIRNYRQQNSEKVCAQRREYRAKNIERFREMDRAYRSRHKEKLAAAKKKYWEEHKYEICRQKMDVYYYDAIQKAGELYPEKIQKLFRQFSFEQYAQRQIDKELRWRRISPSSALYAECYDAGMLAYLYSIHRFALIDCQKPDRYILKMIRILVVCALIVSKETQNLCRKNGLTEIRLNREDVPQLL